MAGYPQHPLDEKPFVLVRSTHLGEFRPEEGEA